MKVYEIPVHGASPGIGGVIVVVAKGKKSALRLMQEELDELNNYRDNSGYSRVTINPNELSGGRLLPEGGGGVYAYDGEA